MSSRLDVSDACPIPLSPTVTKATTTLLSLPVELVVVIVSIVYDSYSEGCSPLSALDQISALWHVNRSLTSIIWDCPPIWRKIANIPLLGSSGQGSHARREWLLQLAADRSHHSLTSLDLAYMSEGANPCWSHALQCLRTVAKSHSSLVKLTLPSLLVEGDLFCDCTRCTDEDRRPRGDPSATPNKMALATLDLLSRTSSLASLTLHLHPLPAVSQLERMVRAVIAKPISLSFAASNWPLSDSIGQEVVIRLASRVQNLRLARPHYDEGERSGGYAALYRSVLHSAAATLHHLELSILVVNLSFSTLTTTTFDLLKTLVVYNDCEDTVLIDLSTASRCNMPALDAIQCPAAFLDAVFAPLVTCAIFTVEQDDDLEVVLESLKGWELLSSLALFLVPITPNAPEDFDQVVTALAIYDTETGPLCPSLVQLGLYFERADYRTDSLLPVESLPREIRWRWSGYVESEGGGTMGNVIEEMIWARQWMSNAQWVALEGNGPNKKLCKPLEKLRIGGFEVSEEILEAFKRLPQALPLLDVVVEPGIKWQSAGGDDIE